MAPCGPMGRAGPICQRASTDGGAPTQRAPAALRCVVAGRRAASYLIRLPIDACPSRFSKAERAGALRPSPFEPSSMSPIRFSFVPSEEGQFFPVEVSESLFPCARNHVSQNLSLVSKRMTHKFLVSKIMVQYFPAPLVRYQKRKIMSHYFLG